MEKSFELVLKTMNRNTVANSQRKGIPNSWSGYSKAVSIMARCELDSLM